MNGQLSKMEQVFRPKVSFFLYDNLPFMKGLGTIFSPVTAECEMPPHNAVCLELELGCEDHALSMGIRHDWHLNPGLTALYSFAILVGG